MAPLMRRVAELYPAALPPHPYLRVEHALLLYVATPLVILAAVLVLAAPGAFLVLAFGRAATAGVLVIRSAATAWGAHVAAFFVLHAITPGTPSRNSFFVTLVGAGVITWLALLARVRRGAASPLPMTEGADRALFGWMTALPVLLTVLLLPVLFWQDFNPDGLEMLTIGRSLDRWMIPRLPTGEATGLGLGMMTVAWPVHWFITLFGRLEAAARLPVVLYMPVLVAGIAAVAEIGMPRRLTRGELASIVLAAGAFVVALGFNATYHPYSADIASPANIDIAMVALMLAMIHALFAGQRRWLIACTVLAYFTRPTAVMLLGLIAIAIVVGDFATIRRRDPRLVDVAAALGVCLVLLLAFERLFALLANVDFAEGSEHIGARVRYLRFDDVRRLLYVLVPSGILPAFALLAYRRFDPPGRLLALVTVGYFAFFYVLAFHVLHHFAPVMVLPVVFYWRLMLRTPARVAITALTAAFAGVGLLLSLPKSMAIDRSERDIGRQLVYRIGEYDGDYSGWRTAFRSKDALDALFDPYWKNPDPEHQRLGSAWLEIHYSHRGEPGPEVNFVVDRPGRAAPPDFSVVLLTDSEAVYVRDRERWRRERYRDFDLRFRSPLYDIPRESMLAIWGVPAHRYTIDLRAIVDRLRGRR